MTQIINLFAGPGAGKSTTAAELFAMFKRAGVNVELVNEYAKDMTWEKRGNILNDQLYILAKQNRRVSRLVGQVDLIITDSPIIMGLAYVPDDYFKHFQALVSDVWHSYHNINFFIDRKDRKYNPIGRNQTYDEAKSLDSVVENLLKTNHIDYKVVETSKAAELIFNDDRFDYLVEG